jgi:hypothetical protein
MDQWAEVTRRRTRIITARTRGGKEDIIIMAVDTRISTMEASSTNTETTIEGIEVATKGTKEVVSSLINLIKEAAIMMVGSIIEAVTKVSVAIVSGVTVVALVIEVEEVKDSWEAEEEIAWEASNLLWIDSIQMETKNKWEEGAKTNSILLIKEENVSSLTLLNNRLISIVKTYANSFWREIAIVELFVPFLIILVTTLANIFMQQEHATKAIWIASFLTNYSRHLKKLIGSLMIMNNF